MSAPEAEPTHHLNPNQELFCNEYLKDRNATQAYIRAGYSADTAEQSGPRLLGNVWVRSRINELIAEQIKNIKIDVKYILTGILKRAEVNIVDAYAEDGTLKPLQEMPEHLQRAIVEVKTEELYEGTGKERERIGTAKTIKIESGLKALELLGRHLKMFTDVHEIPGLEKLAEQIQAARKRADKCRE